jgi:hypothetical protein
MRITAGAVVLAAACWAMLGMRPAAADDPVLRRAIDYVETFERTFSSVTWRERYEQEDRVMERTGTVGPRVPRLAGKRQLDAHMLLVWLPRDATWVSVRDVIAVDGKPRPDSERPLERLASGDASITTAQLMTLAAENGRYNIGRILRTFNEPTLTLTFLDDHYRPRFKFNRRGEDTLPDGRARLYTFDEKERPTVIRNDRRDLPASGTLWIAEDTGRILKTSMTVSIGDIRATMDVRYGPHPDFEVLVPLDMRETYEVKNGEQVTTHATYSEFRRFETKGRLIVPK